MKVVRLMVTASVTIEAMEMSVVRKETEREMVEDIKQK